MKNIISILLLNTILFWVSCDKIEPPYTQMNNNITEKTILIEKFTGHKCSNCPDANRKIEILKDFYGDNIISVAIHPSQLAEFTGLDENYSYNFTTNDGDIIANDMGATFLPLGTVNRIEGGISNRCFLKDDWATQIDNLLYDEDGNLIPKNMTININTTFNNNSKQLDIITNFSFISNSFKYDNYKLCAFIMEDSIIAPQLDGTEYIENYEHNSIYRCAINGTYGENITNFASFYLDEKLSYQAIHNISLNENYNANWTNDWNNSNNCYVVAYVYNTETMIIEHVEKKQIGNY
tara:strand:- start:127 stop:1008 length:882 start_codon:yes stop_codon:yes gene_type:complete